MKRNKIIIFEKNIKIKIFECKKWMVVVAEQNNKRRPFAFLLIIHVYKEERCEVVVEKNIAHFDVKVAIQNL